MADETQQVAGFTEEQKDTLRSVFDGIDKDGSGYMERSEIAGLMLEFHQVLTQQELDEIIAKADEKGTDDGKISFEELLALMEESDCIQNPEDVEQTMKAAFQHFDKKKDGYISREELICVLTEHGEEKFSKEEAEEMIAMFDTVVDDDGRLNYEKLCKLMVAAKMIDVLPDE